ncbi:class I SAM-dependent methyltransferase [Arenicella xantha]|uniref:Methyltransferase family protein n=1 Tax=Arenicella xantha TaxID=644221 RepID=A0A395JRB4_9GAMM|nr:methyltransferase domain-containing protein [Arenicella xantha]RBP52872.1 methyltransferase family protein [Arenicella xantha]
MKTSLINSIQCPKCESMLTVDEAATKPVYRESNNELHEGILVCTSCAKQYPVICGIAILLANPNSWLRSNYSYIVEGAFNSGGISEPLRKYLDQHGWRMSASPANNYYELPRWVDIFLATHYDPVPAGSDDNSELGALLAKQPSVFEYVANTLKRLQPEGIKRALDVGANVGGMTWRLASQAESVLAIDTAFNPLLAARKLQLGLPSAKTTVRRYIDGLRHEEITVGPFNTNVEFLVASLFELPVAGKFDVITALNVIDVVPDPEAFLDVLIDRLEPGGLLILTSPYSWGSDDVPIDNWIGDADTPSNEAVNRLLIDKKLSIQDETDFVPWILREHSRWYRVFHNHCVIARKG